MEREHLGECRLVSFLETGIYCSSTVLYVCRAIIPEAYMVMLLLSGTYRTCWRDEAVTTLADYSGGGRCE